MDAQPTDSARLLEARRLKLELNKKMRELNDIDRALNRVLGMDTEDRPKKPRMSGKDFRQACGVK